MEPYNQEEYTNSSEEVVAEQENNDLGVGRSYECVFCKRGFNTAQALGGHMNIHRKDRARNKPAKSEENHYFGPRIYQQTMPAAESRSCNLSGNVSFQQNFSTSATYFPESSSSTMMVPSYGSQYFPQQYCSSSDHFSQQHTDESNDPMIHDDWRLSLSLNFNPAAIEDLQKKNRPAIMSQNEDVDLELRLGYHS